MMRRLARYYLAVILGALWLAAGCVSHEYSGLTIQAEPGSLVPISALNQSPQVLTTTEPIDYRGSDGAESTMSTASTESAVATGTRELRVRGAALMLMQGDHSKATDAQTDAALTALSNLRKSSAGAGAKGTGTSDQTLDDADEITPTVEIPIGPGG